MEGKEQVRVKAHNGMLTDRELKVLHMLAEGKTNPQIEEALGYSKRTITAVTNRVYMKLEANNRAAAVHNAHTIGLLHANPREAGAMMLYRLARSMGYKITGLERIKGDG